MEKNGDSMARITDGKYKGRGFETVKNVFKI